MNEWGAPPWCEAVNFSNLRAARLAEVTAPAIAKALSDVLQMEALPSTRGIYLKEVAGFTLAMRNLMETL